MLVISIHSDLVTKKIAMLENAPMNASTSSSVGVYTISVLFVGLLAYAMGCLSHPLVPTLH